MKRLILLIAILSLSGCGVSKKSYQSSEKVIEAVKSTENAQYGRNERISEERDLNIGNIEEKEIVIHRIEYDVSAPKDETTGRHPIKSESIISSHKKSDSKLLDQSHINTIKIDSVIVNKTNDVDTTKDVNIATSEERDGSKWIGRIVTGIVSLIILAMCVFCAYWFYRRRRV